MVNISQLLDSMIQKAQKECREYYKKSPQCNIINYDGIKEEIVDSISSIYIPDHLEKITYELLKNALRNITHMI